MSKTKQRGYRVERKIRMMFEKYGWKTIRAGASLGEADIVCIKSGECLLLQIKSTKGKKRLYYYEYMKPKLEGVPYFVVVDFGYGKIRITKPKKILSQGEGVDLKKFLKNPKAAMRILKT